MGTCWSTHTAVERVSNVSNVLRECTREGTPKWTLEGRSQMAKVLHVVDGDTLDVAIELETGCYQFRVRLYGIDTPEKRPSKSNPNRLEEIAASHAATQALSALLESSEFLVHVKFRNADKYGRWLCELKLPSLSAVTINEWMIEQGHAKPYFGGTKESTFISETRI